MFWKVLELVHTPVGSHAPRLARPACLGLAGYHWAGPVSLLRMRVSLLGLIGVLLGVGGFIESYWDLEGS